MADMASQRGNANLFWRPGVTAVAPLIYAKIHYYLYHRADTSILLYSNFIYTERKTKRIF